MCKNVGKTIKNFDIAIIGDSFTEGIGMPYEDTFVGIISKKFKNKKIANLGVSGYSPSIYFIKIKELLKQGYNFNEVVIYIDINDVFNEARSYRILDNKILPIDKKKEKTVDYLVNKNNEFNLKKFFRNYFTFTYENLHLIKMAIYRFQNKKIFPYVLNLDMVAWTYDKSAKGFGEIGIEGGIEKSIKITNQLIDMLDEKKIKYSIGVYPYPSTLFYDKVESEHVLIWKKLCENRCKKFYNNFPFFFKEAKEFGPIETYYKYYIFRDVHLNKNGHKIVAENFIKNYE